MKSNRAILMILIAGMLILSGCSNLPIGAANQADPTATPDVQATVDYAVAMTATAQAAEQETIDAAVQATVEALPSPTPVPTVEVVELTEEELTELIDEAVAEAVAATEEVYTTTSQATYDDTISEEELYYMDYYMYAAELALEYADDLIMMYYDYYGLYADEMIDLLYEIEDDLALMAESMAEIDAIIQQGAEAASAAIDQLNEAAAAAQVRHDELQDNAQNWLASAQTEREDRLAELQNMIPSESAGNLDGALVLLHEYVDSVKNGFSDGKINMEEWMDIAQRGINAQTSLEQFARPNMQNLSSGIGNMSNMIALGEWPQARGELPSFELSLPERPSGPNISLPNRP